MKFAYLIFTEDYGIYGTNDKKVAEEATEYNIVVDTVAGTIAGNDEEGDAQKDLPITDWETAITEAHGDDSDD